MIKLIATDMDGTLLNHKGELPDGFYELFNELIDKKVKLVIASGRQYHTLLSNFTRVKDDIIIIAENGAFVMHHGKEIFSRTLDRGMIEEIYHDVSKVKNCDIVLCGKASAYINTKNSEFEEDVRKYYKKCKYVEDLLKVEDEILKIAVYDYFDSKENSYKALSPKWSKAANLIVSGKHWMDFGSLDVDKGVSLKQIQNALSISKDETLVFGDYFNDVPMMKESNYSYAMENAPDEVKKHSRFIAPANSEEGVLKVIQNYLEEGFI